MAILFHLFVEVEFSTDNVGEFGNYVIGEAGVLNKIPRPMLFTVFSGDPVDREHNTGDSIPALRSEAKQ